MEIAWLAAFGTIRACEAFAWRFGIVAGVVLRRGAALALVRAWRAIGRAMARLTLMLIGFWPCFGIQRSGLNGRTPSQWATGAVLILSNHVSWIDILVCRAHTLGRLLIVPVACMTVQFSVGRPGPCC